MGEQGVVGGFRIHDKIALRLDVVDDAFLLFPPVLADHEAKIEIGDGARRNDVVGAGSGIRRAHPVDVQGGEIEEFQEFFASALNTAQGEFLTNGFVIDGRIGDCLFLQRAERGDVVVEVRNEDVAIGVLHAREKLGEHHGWIWRPVAVVSAMQPSSGTEDGDFEMSVSASAKDNGLPSALVHGAITNEHDIAVHEITIGAQD